MINDIMIRLKNAFGNMRNDQGVVPGNSALTVCGTILTLTAFAISAGIIPPLITSISDDLGINYSYIGYFIMLQYGCFFIAGISGGWLSEQFQIHSRVMVLIGWLFPLC